MIDTTTKDAIVQTLREHLGCLPQNWWQHNMPAGQKLLRGVEVTHPKRNLLQIAVKTNHGLRFYEVLVKESYS